MKRITKICQNCKTILIVNNNDDNMCINCNHKQLVDTHPENYLHAINFDKNNFKYSL